jgi:hypothetical protein
MCMVADKFFPKITTFWKIKTKNALKNLIKFKIKFKNILILLLKVLTTFNIDKSLSKYSSKSITNK